MKQTHSIVIGGTGGLGKVVVKTLEQDEHLVSVLTRNPPSNERHSLLHYIQADLFDIDNCLHEINKAIVTRGKIQHLIFLQRFRGTTESWENDLEIGLNVTRQIIDHLSQAFDTTSGSNSSIIIVSSVAGKLANHSQPLSYSIVKAGLNHMVKYYAAQLGPKGIRVNAVSPIGFVKEESKKFYYHDKKELSELYEKIVPLGRMCTTEDIANVISFLCSKKAAYISAQNIIVDGGLSALAHESLAMELKGI